MFEADTEDKQPPVVIGVTLESKGFRSESMKDGFLSDMEVPEVKGGREGGGLYGESREIVGGEILDVDPDVGGLFDFLGRVLFPLDVPFCCCCCC